MRRRSTSSSVSTEQCVSAKAKEVLHLLTRKGPLLTPKQQEYCSEACINRFLGTTRHQKKESVKKAAGQLRATLTWRARFDVDSFTADEFSAELAAGAAYVAGHDEQHRPVLIVTLNSETSTNEAQKKLLRFFVFTLEVAIASMDTPVEQCVLIIQAGSLRKKGSRAISTVFQLLKLFNDHYPKCLARAFILDAPFMFYYVWKGLGSLLDLGTNNGLRFVYTRTYTSTQAPTSTATHLVRAVKSYSNGSFEWEEQDGETSAKPIKCIQSHEKFRANTSTTSPSCNNEASLLYNKSKARSASFATSWIRPLIKSKESEKAVEFRSFRAQTSKQQGQGPQKEQEESRRWCDLSLITEAEEESDITHNQLEHRNSKQKATDMFRPYYFAFIKCKPYNEAVYRAKLKPPLAGLISIVSSDLSCIKYQRHEAKRLQLGTETA